MTALNISTDIPSSINSLEKLAMWTGIALATINPSNRVLINANETGRQAEYTVYPGGDNEVYYSTRIIVRLAPDYSYNDSIRLWENAQDISNTALPAGLKTNVS